MISRCGKPKRKFRLNTEAMASGAATYGIIEPDLYLAVVFLPLRRQQIMKVSTGIVMLDS